MFLVKVNNMTAVCALCVTHWIDLAHFDCRTRPGTLLRRLRSWTRLVMRHSCG
jgi:hypothetical protein